MKKVVTKNTEEMSIGEMKMYLKLIKKEIIKRSGVDVEKHFLCPLSFDVIPKRYGKKIMEKKITRHYVSERWFYMSRKEFNLIKRNG